MVHVKLTICDVNAETELNVKTIADIVSKEVSVVKHTFEGKKDIPVIVLEENHNSRIGQLQHAISLVRLYNQYNMKDIALEGYLKERPEINIDWFISATRGLDILDKASIAIRFLKEGEISSAEFMKLVYNDIILHPIETKVEYEVELDGNLAVQGLSAYLNAIATNSSKDNEWVQEKIKALNDVKAIKTRAIGTNLAIAEEIPQRAKKLSLKISANDQQAMESYLNFLRGRVAADKTLFDSTIQVVEQKNSHVVAMIIGAAHTEGINKMLNAAQYSFAVLRPICLENMDEKGDLPNDLYMRKYKRLSVFSEGFFTEELLKSFSLSLKKPEPVLDENWFKAKATLYASTQKIVNALANGETPPFGFTPDELDFKPFLSIDPGRIKIVYDDNDKRKGQAVLFPVTFNPGNSAQQSELWIKAARGITKESGDIELMLKKAIKEIQEEATELDSTLEDEEGRVQISRNTVAVVAPTEEKALTTEVFAQQLTTM